MSDNLRLYNDVRVVPQTAKKPISGGRLKGMTDINPMWRLKALTEQFGVCGVGWRYEIVDKRLEEGAGGEIAAFVDINLYIKMDSEWSEAIPGTGGSSFVTKERNGLYMSDECFKMALTDAISVSCKALGFGADVYWDSDTTKYNRPSNEAKPKQTKKPPAKSNKQTTDSETEQEIGRVQIMNTVINLAKEKGINLTSLNKGVAKYFPGNDNIANLDKKQLNSLMDKINAGGDMK